MGAVVRQARRLLEHEGPLVGRRVLAMCSGGVDSVVLVEALSRLPRGAAPLALHVLWLDHSLRAEVEEELAAARAAADRAGAPLHVRRAEPSALGRVGGRQAAARAWRYDVAREVAQALRCEVVATGHTASDQLENALLSLTGVTGGGIRAMPAARQLAPNVRLVRPLLAVSREQVEAAAREASLPWVDDPTNGQPEAGARNRVRAEVVPALLGAHPQAGPALARVARRERERSDALGGLAVQLLREWGADHTLDARRLAQLPPPARGCVVAEWLRRSGAGRALSERVVESVLQLARPPRGSGQVCLPRGWCVRRDRYDLVLQPPTTGDVLT